MKEDNYVEKPIRVTADSACDVLPEWTAAYGIGFIHHVVHTNRGMFEDGGEIDADELCHYLRTPENTAKSEAPDEEAFVMFFSQQLREADEILHLTISSRTSSAYEAAKKAGNRFGRVQVFDTGDLAGGAGLFVLYAAFLAKRHHTIGEITDALARLKTEIRSGYVLRGTEYLQKAGMMSPFLGGMLTAFLLHPVLLMKNDRMRFRFSWSARYRELHIRRMLARAGSVDRSLLVIPHASLPEEELLWVQREVARYVQFDRVICLPMSAAVTANVGEGTFGLVFRSVPSEKRLGRLFDFLPLQEEQA